MRPATRYELRPTGSQTFEIAAADGRSCFAAELERSYALQSEGRFREACEVRYASFRRLADILPDDEAVELEWSHAESRAAVETVHASAADHFLAGDTELATALLELLLELDPEDHTGGTALLGFCYVEGEEYELYDELTLDLGDTPEGCLLAAWASFRRTGEVSQAAAEALRSRCTALVEEFCREEHPADEAFMADMESDRPSKAAEARRLWLQTECLWSRHGDFTAEMKRLFL